MGSPSFSIIKAVSKLELEDMVKLKLSALRLTCVIPRNLWPQDSKRSMAVLSHACHFSGSENSLNLLNSVIKTTADTCPLHSV